MQPQFTQTSELVPTLRLYMRKITRRAGRSSHTMEQLFGVFARRDVAQLGSAPVLGTGGRGFKSRRPDSVGSLSISRMPRDPNFSLHYQLRLARLCVLLLPCAPSFSRAHRTVAIYTKRVVRRRTRNSPKGPKLCWVISLKPRNWCMRRKNRQEVVSTRHDLNAKCPG